MGPVLAWCRLHTVLRAPIMVGENVFDLPDALYRLNLPCHNIQVIEVDPADVGFGLIARHRKLILCTEKTHIKVNLAWETVYNMICDVLRVVLTKPRDVLLADMEEVYEEAQHLAEKRKAEFRPTPDLFYLLSYTEAGYLSNYGRMHWERGEIISEDTIYNLADNPLNRVTWSVHSHKIPTYRRNSTLMWNPARRRWLTSLERLASMGWPTYPALAQASGVPTMHIPLQATSHMLGNAVCIPNIGVALLAALASTSVVE